GRIVPNGVRWIWPDAIAGRVRLEPPPGPPASAAELTALAARGAVAQADAAFRAMLRVAPGRERALREAVATGYLQGGKPSKALPLVHDLPLLRAAAFLDLGRVRDAEAELAALPRAALEGPVARRLAAAVANARGDFAAAERLLGGLGPEGGVDAEVALGLVLANRGALAEAGAVLRAALPRLGEDRPFMRAAALTNLAEVCRREGDLATSRAHHAAALALLQSVGHVRCTAIASSNLGVVAKDLGRPDEAIEHHRRAKALFAHVGDARGAALAEANLGIASLETGDVDLAARRLQHA